MIELAQAIVPRPIRRLVTRARRWIRSRPSRTARQKRELLASNSFTGDELRLLADIDSRIAPDDDMYLGSLEHYFKVGLSAIRNIDDAIAAAHGTEVRTILDVPCGYGRVLRFLVHHFPNAAITGCELMPDAVRFCAERYGAQPVVSRTDLNEVQIDRRFDVIWCGSLITHFDAANTRELFAFFRRQLAPGGVVVFTAHGDYVAQRMPAMEHPYGLARSTIPRLISGYANSGQAYADYPGENGYGISLTSPEWIRAAAAEAGLREVYFNPRGWHFHQDVYGFVLASRVVEQECAAC